MRSAELLHRLAGGIFVLWLVSVLAFLMVHLVPGDAADMIAGEGSTEEQVAAIRAQLGLDQPVLQQYLSWTGRVLSGDLGSSVFSQTPVTELMLEAAPVTLSLAGVAMVIAIVLGVPAGAIAARRPGGWLDGIVSSVATLSLAMPNFWVAMILVSLFAIANPWLPATGYADFEDGVGVWLSHVILPAAALGLHSAGELARHTRGAAADVFTHPYIRSARARGASGWWLVRHHVLRNASIPVLTILGLQIGRLLAGVIVVEAVAGMNGIGTVAVTAISRRDFPVIQGYVLFCAVVIVCVSLLVDLAYTWINPKVRSAGS